MARGTCKHPPQQQASADRRTLVPKRWSPASVGSGKSGGRLCASPKDILLFGPRAFVRPTWPVAHHSSSPRGDCQLPSISGGGPDLPRQIVIHQAASRPCLVVTYLTLLYSRLESDMRAEHYLITVGERLVVFVHCPSYC